MKLLKQDVFGNVLLIKRYLIRILGIISHRRFRGTNHLIIDGSEIINNLPDKNVLFVSNHQTYFADVTAMIHVFNASLNGRWNSLKKRSYLKNIKLNIYFIAAKETMNSGIIPKILSYAGAIPISRTWREHGRDIKRKVNKEEIRNVQKALHNGWVITFPQGTTKPWSPIRKGTAHIIKENKPLVVPIVIDRFRRSFDKTGLRIKKKGTKQHLKIKQPLVIDYNSETLDSIVEKISFAIEQHHSDEYKTTG
ncbi:MAG: 1-acyl-sn-glycerol-3-phosphate acyltransferase [Flavobacteriales bacterium]|nr:1-acyl-sn-glycerol-3-phosphate acyltransferase [Flavobacteriales bacterium]|tara:strand:+ start:691 stop:1443 length:753 start_codon:yes stop_codon:yes gene_type:complete